MKARFRILGIGFLIGLLVLIRFFETSLFYDPLINFFKLEYLLNKTPDFEAARLLINVAFRFALNTLISLAIIYVAFFDKNILKFSTALFLLLFLICFPVFFFFVYTIENQNFMALFYVRRFLIHPIFVIILLPAFYYYRLKTRKNNNVESFARKN
ncbi:exosortase F system-associated protein [Antarcticibacterium sp. 1MA-6-2]|uniref:exosortase F system-associated membrane protein n=1 Tax=Antarcticibacterium sp. 1MA-6-2 TaxID=2908210 RepID=UPI001F43D86B|nr:exosortase F system-associated protein [Antarcticibacterium sp. 1MA-6-2]UJH89821.1 exosortase F system-associated protein [Antarcticibacterium sp. 1MA-6-2]